MHMVIRAIVYANDEEEAMERARDVFDSLCEDHIFDYYTTFDEDEPMSGRARWGDLPVVAKADSPEGITLIDGGMEATKKEFMNYISRIRRILDEYTDEELYEAKYDSFYNDIRFNARQLGQRRGTTIWLYDHEGAGITTPDHLKDVLSKWRRIYEDKGKENPYDKDKEIWVVPADVHR